MSESTWLNHLPPAGPQLVVSEERVRKNLERMEAKALGAGVRLRPHAKTHCSATVAAWARETGIHELTVSSLNMASYFAEQGWEDITIAVPADPARAEEYDALAAGIRLGILVDHPQAARNLVGSLSSSMRIWIKVDVGYGRAGVLWDDAEALVDLADILKHTSSNISFAGILTHAGHAYHVGGEEEILSVHNQSIERLAAAARHIRQAGIDVPELSVGDTPTCSIASDFPGINEIRPGNFVYYDLMQWRAGVCQPEELAAVVCCPVIGLQHRRNRVLIHGGAVHLSKDALTDEQGKQIFGYLVTPDETAWGGPIVTAPVVALSQEHGTIQFENPPDTWPAVGDRLLIAPIHSCLAASALHAAVTTHGEQLQLMPHRS